MEGGVAGANAPLLIHTANRRLFDTLVKTTFPPPGSQLVVKPKTSRAEGRRRKRAPQQLGRADKWAPAKPVSARVRCISDTCAG